MISARKLLKSLSVKEGIKYDSPESVRDIPGFIHFHNLNVDEILDPLPTFSTWFPLRTLCSGLKSTRSPETFNQFFYR